MPSLCIHISFCPAFVACVNSVICHLFFVTYRQRYENVLVAVPLPPVSPATTATTSTRGGTPATTSVMTTAETFEFYFAQVVLLFNSELP